MCFALALLLAAPPRTPDTPREVSWPPEPQARQDVEPQSVPTAPELSAAPPSPQTLATPRVRVAIGFDPTAVGTPAERALVDALAAAANATDDPRARVRRLRLGAPQAREVCREGRDDFVLMVGYIGQRADPVVLPYDCVLDTALAVRSQAAADQPGLLAALWAEHVAQLQDGAKARRRWGRGSPTTRVALVAGVALVAVGVAVGILVATALRDDVVVFTVGP